MNVRQLSFACVLLKMTFDLSTAQLLKPGRCPSCPEGYFVRKNCSAGRGRIWGVQCRRCTNCSAAHQDTLLQCSTFADSLCGHRTTPAITLTPIHAPVSAPQLQIIPAVLVLSVFLALLLVSILTLLTCRNHQRNKPQGVVQL